MDFTKLKKIYMIGIKGVGMTMLAQYLHGKGIEISGSDTEEKFMSDAVLEKSGIKVIEKFSAGNIPGNADLIVYSTAYTAENNKELKAALEGKIKTVTYAEALGAVFNQRYGIAVAGSHGKTTTTAWLGFVLNLSGLYPSVMVGARVPQFDGAGLIGSSDYLIVEADEYQNKLRYLSPRAVLLSNIDYDHPDFFSTKEEYRAVFIDLIKRIPAGGFLVANFDDGLIRKTARVNCRGKVISYALDALADYTAYDIKHADNRQYFKVKLGQGTDGEGAAEGDSVDGNLGEFCIKPAGRHNISNALAVIATAVELGVELADIRRYLEEFTGTARRLQIVGEFRGATIIDDYAHHPTEIKASLSAVRELYKYRKVIVVFHPHTFTRTKVLLDDFAASFHEADEVIVLDIYGSAREKRGGVTSKELVEKIKEAELDYAPRLETVENIRFLGNVDFSVAVHYIGTLEECERYLRKRLEGDEVVVLMGAGDVFRIGERLVAGE